MSKSASVAPEINLLGKTVDEAMSVLDKYLDDAYLAHLDHRAHRPRKGHRRPAQCGTEPSAQSKIRQILPPWGIW